MERCSNGLVELEVGEAVKAHNLAMFPLTGGGMEDPGYLTLDEAIATNQFVVEELRSAEVNTLAAHNKLARPFS